MSKKGNKMKKITKKFHVENDQIVKTTNGEILKENEPLYLLRARDHLALPLLETYYKMCISDGCTDYMLNDLKEIITDFRKFKENNPQIMKQPGITMGK